MILTQSWENSREVLPYNKNVWIDEKKTQIGYEIPFTRYFYKYVAPEKSDDILARIRENPFKEINHTHVYAFEDYLTLKRYENGVELPIDLPKSDVLRFILDDNSIISIRPSGTEPKCKFYYCVKGHYTEAEIQNMKLEPFLIHINRITL